MDVHGTGSLSNLNGVLEVGESAVVEPGWQNLLTSPVAFTGIASAFTGPAGPVYTLDDSVADYGSVAAGATADCDTATPAHDCYRMSITGARPAAHWDATFDEALGSGTSTIAGTWTLHVGESFPDVPTAHPFYFFVENLFHNGITGAAAAGTTARRRPSPAVRWRCSSSSPSTAAPTRRRGCSPGVFPDVACPGPFADWIEQLFQEGITGGCAPGLYCPDDAVTRAQMAVFLLKANQGAAYVPPPCTGSVFTDVPCAGGAFDPWIEDLAGRGITGGCGGGPLLPGQSEQPRTDGGLPRQVIRAAAARSVARRAGIRAETPRRRCPGSRAARSCSRASAGPRRAGRGRTSSRRRGACGSSRSTRRRSRARGSRPRYSSAAQVSLPNITRSWYFTNQSRAKRGWRPSSASTAPISV